MYVYIYIYIYIYISLATQKTTKIAVRPRGVRGTVAQTLREGEGTVD